MGTMDTPEQAILKLEYNRTEGEREENKLAYAHGRRT
jgi:hypothetical protein